MAADDDIDMLLDEVERRYCTPISIATPTNTTISKATMVHHHANIKPTHSAESTDYKITDDVIGNDEDLDKIISEIISDTSDGDAVTSSTKMRGRLVQKTDTSTYSKTLRCTPVLLTGTATSLGYSDGHTQRACDQLRCTSCDFHVITFDNHVWHSRSDYLFFRNRMPDRKKLAQNLVHKKGYRAYACQCSWRSVVGFEELGGRGDGWRGRERREGEHHQQGEGGGEERSERKEKSCEKDNTPLAKLKWVCSRHPN